MEFSNKFVCEDIAYSTYHKNIPAPLFRKSFKIENSVKNAEILICGLGFYDLFVNGQKITKGYLAPYISNSDHICYYDNYNITKYLTVGENVIGIMLGDGFQVGKTYAWFFKDNIINSAPLLAVSVKIESEKDTLTFEADDFNCKKGPVLFNDLRSGVFYDARLEEDGWCYPGFKETGWHKPICDAYKPRGYAKICEAEPIKIQREIKPICIKKGGLVTYIPQREVEESPFENAPKRDGGYIYDFGENNAGIFRLKIKGKRGQKVSIQCAEQMIGDKLDYNNWVFFTDGFVQRDIYYLKGDGEEVFEPMFTYHGFRYLYVSGITEEQATEDLLTYLVMSSDLEQRGTFECSDEIANKIYEAGKRSDSANFYYFPTDCPHREKNGWTGDAAESAEHMIMTLGVEKSWREWLFNIRASQKENGQLPGVVPTSTFGYKWGNGPAWDRVLFYLPYYAYKYRGETEIIKENAHAMLRYLEYIASRRNEKGIIAIGLNDWVPVERTDGGKNSNADLGFTDTVMTYVMCRMSSEMFEKIGLNLSKDFADKLGIELLEAIRREYIDLNTYTVSGRYQTTQAMAIFYDIFNEEEKAKAFEVLKEIIREDNYSITSGFLGLRVIFHVLSDFGEADTAYKMITKLEYPSYGYWIKQGETSLLEQFCPYDENGFYRHSKNHHFLGDVVNWFMRSPGGINVINSHEVEIKPHFINQLSWCKASHKLPNGSVSVFWERKDGKVKLTVETDGDIECRVISGEKILEKKDGGKYIFN